MPENKDDKKEHSTWITVGGKKIEIPAGEEGEEALREKLPTLRGAKESNTKEAQKSYIMRHGLLKSLFNIRDEVVFDEYKKSGIVSGFAGDNLTIMAEGRVYKKDKNHVFKKDELIGKVHWDTLPNSSRIEILKSHNVSVDYVKQNWQNLSVEIRSVLKEASPAGFSTATTGTHNAIYNPINEEKTVSQRIEEEIERQHKMPSHEDLEDGEGKGGGDTGKDEKKGKD